MLTQSCAMKFLLATVMLLVLIGPAAGQDLDPPDDIQRELSCLATNIYREAASESWLGKMAVAQIVMNRLRSGNYGSSVCDVVYQRNRTTYGRIVCQFSWTCMSQIKLSPAQGSNWEDSLEAAKRTLLDGETVSRVKDALYFRNPKIGTMPGAVLVAKIGNHWFYRDPR